MGWWSPWDGGEEMLAIKQLFVDAVKSATKGFDLFAGLQKAIELEHATVPPYLVAAYSLKGANTGIRNIILDIAREEMLHMAIVCNLLTALGSKANIAGADFVPKYPSSLPMGIQGSLQVGLAKFSLELVRDVFMKIEEPEKPLQFPMAAGPTFSTIGAFYQALMEKIDELGDAVFIAPVERQVFGPATGFLETRLFPITNVQTALAALDALVSDGEGTTTSPLDSTKQLAHYYRFAAIFHGKELVPDATVPEGYAYRGAAIPFDPAEVFDFPDNAKVADHAPGSVPRQAMEAFNRRYSAVLRDLDATFGGRPELMAPTMAKMVQLRGPAAVAISGNVGVSFEYMPP